jgi:two-component system, chemotaxis family, chemotaxis protein CheY
MLSGRFQEPNPDSVEGSGMKTVLLVDDSRAVRLAGKRIFEALGFGTLEAGDGQQALDVVASHPSIDAVLLDWNMPVMNGLDFLKTLRSQAVAQPVVVMCTTENDIAHITEALTAGANEYVMKPFTEDIIREKLQETGVL